MVDVIGKEVKVGDKVAFDKPYYKRLCVGEIIKITPKGVTIEYGDGIRISRLSNQIAWVEWRSE